MREAETLSDLASDLDLLRGAAAEAGRIAMRHFRNDPDVWLKGGSSPVSAADIAVDTFLKSELLAARPDYGWLSEETVDSPARLSARRTFVVDPIDGTRAFIEGGDTWCVSIAVVENGLSLTGVLDCPALREEYWAVRGGGSFADGERLHLGPPPEPARVGGPKPMLSALPPALRARIVPAGYVPSLAYRLAKLARGRLDAALVKPNSHDWDIAAADLILREAGGRIMDARGKSPLYAGADVRHGALVAGSGALLDELVAALRE